MKTILFIISLLTTMNTYAYTVYANKTINDIYTYSNYVIVKFSPAQFNDQGCLSTDRVAIDLSDGKNKSLFTAAMVAASNGRKVNIRANGGCLNNSNWSAPKAYQIRIRF